MNFITGIRRARYLWLVAIFLSSPASAAIIPIDLNAFFPSEPEVVISSDGVTATMNESPIIAVVTLDNDPFLGDAEVIVAAPSRLLTFDFDFNELPGNDDVFSATLFDSGLGPVNGVLEALEIDATRAGAASFDLSPWVGVTLGLSFTLFDLNPQGLQDSTVTVTRLQLNDESAVPLPPSLLLLFSGMVFLASRLSFSTTSRSGV